MLNKLVKFIKVLIKRNFFLVCVYYLYDDLVAKRRFIAGDFETDSGTLHSTIGLDQSIKYIYDVYQDYKTYGQFNRFYGRVAEVGPGDNCGVALLCLADGCERIDLVDRFYSRRNFDSQSQIYLKLMESNKYIHDLLISKNLNDESTFPNIIRHYGPYAEAETFFSNQEEYDFIISRAVMEHVYDPISALEKMTFSLSDGGMLLHKVDLRDHGMFSDYFYELKFYEVPDSIYERMTFASGRPNRVLIDKYRKYLNESTLQYKLLITRLAGIGEINPHTEYESIPYDIREKSKEFVNHYKNKFSKSISLIPDSDISITGFFLIAQKSH